MAGICYLRDERRAVKPELRKMLVINCQGWKKQKTAIEVVDGCPLPKSWDGFYNNLFVLCYQSVESRY